MPPFATSTEPLMPELEPMRLVLVPLQCFYCGDAAEEILCEWRICHLFGLFHCEAHTDLAARDCKNFMKEHGWVRKLDAAWHPVLGPFLQSLGSNIPVLRTSGAVEQGWFFPSLDGKVPIRKSKTTQEWGLNLVNGDLARFMPLSQFQDPRVSPFVSPMALSQVTSVITYLESGIYN